MVKKTDYLIKNAVILWNIITMYYYKIFLNWAVFYFNVLIYSCDGKAEFSASLLQSSVSHDPLRSILIGWFDAQETFIIDV